MLELARQRGFLGPGPVEPHVERALDAVPLLPTPAHRVVDLGSGGGLPGLPLALAIPDSRWLLLDGSVTRCGFLRQATHDLGLSDRIEVLAARAESAGRDPALRGAFDAVVARSFGPPAVVAECGAAFLRLGGRLIVAEPPGSTPERWPADGLRQLGLEVAGLTDHPSAYATLGQTAPCPDRFPRRTGVPAKRPLF